MKYILLLITELILYLWVSIACLLPILTIMGKKRMGCSSGEMWKLSINTGKEMWKENIGKYIGTTIIFIVIRISIENNQDKVPMLGELFTNILGVLLISNIISIIIEKVNWYLVSSMLGMEAINFVVKKMLKEKSIERYIPYLAFFLSLGFTILIISIIKIICIIYKDQKRKRIYKKIQLVIRKDLFNRTPNIQVSLDNIFQIQQICEILYYEFYKRYLKVKGINEIKYVTLNGKYKMEWYRKSAKIMKIFVGVCIVWSIFFAEWKEKTGIFLCIVVFLGNVQWLKKNDPDYLAVIAIRYFYDEWGYYVKYQEGDKFVGNVQMIEKSKYHYFVHSFLNIAALGRIVALRDKWNRKNDIENVSNNILELSDIYIRDTVDWVALLPLWISALFEYDVNKKVGNNVCKRLSATCTKKDEKLNLEVFLYSFWLSIIRKMPNDENGKFIMNFMNYIINQE